MKGLLVFIFLYHIATFITLVRGWPSIVNKTFDRYPLSVLCVIFVVNVLLFILLVRRNRGNHTNAKLWS